MIMHYQRNSRDWPLLLCFG